MATSKFAERIRKPLRALGFGVAPATTTADADVATITSGAGAPTATTEPNGSLYLRTDGTNGDDSLYMYIGGSWFAMKCETA